MSLRHLPRLLLAILLGVIAALLVSCGSSGKGLIPAQSAGPLQSDFERVAQAAEAGTGECGQTEAAILTTERDLLALPSSVDAGLRRTLTAGVANLRERALALCKQPATTEANTTTQTTTTQTSTTPTTTTQTTTETSTETVPTVTETTPTTTTSGPGGGTVAPGEEHAPGGAGNAQGPAPATGGVGQGGGQ